MVTGLLFISLMMHLVVITSAYIVRKDPMARSSAEDVVLGGVMFSAVAVLLGLFK